MDFSTLLLLFISILAGFIASAPIGPVNLWVTSLYFGQDKKVIHWFLAGVILVDVAYVFLAFWSYFMWNSQNGSEFTTTWEISGGIFIMMVGFFSLLKNQKNAKGSPPKQYQPLKAFLLGLFVCVSNSMLYVMWLFIAGIFDNYHLVADSYLKILIVLFGVFLGDLLWFGFYVFLIQKGVANFQKINPTRIQKIVAISLVLFGLFTACRHL